MIAPPASPVLPKVPKLERDNIPEVLRAISRWIVWRAGPLKPTGKFDKIPCDPVRGRNIDAQNPKNWLSYANALAAYDQGVGDGIGIILSSEHRVNLEGTDYILVASDFDKCTARINEIKELGLRLGMPYIEISPSGEGLRLFALSSRALKGGNDGNGHELYCNNRFVTVTGLGGRGEIKDCTIGLAALEQKWFGAKEKEKVTQPFSKLSSASLPETEQNIERLRKALAFLSSDTDYETWRNIVWSILSTGWSCAEQIAKEWSLTASRRYDENAFQNVRNSFDPSRGISLGTLYHYAKRSGWSGPAGADYSGHPAETPADPTLSKRLLTAEEVKALPNLPYRVKGLLPAKGLATIYGEPSGGKSFLALDLALNIAAADAAGRKWFGKSVNRAPVIYIALEGRGGVSKRIKAWEAHNGAQASLQIKFLLQNFGLLEPKGIAELSQEILATVGQGAVVFVDTLNQSAPGADENSSKDMGSVLANAKELADRVDGLVVLIHHAGKDRAKGMRGHSSLIAAMDAAIEVSSSNNGRSWKVVKARDDESGIVHGFELFPHSVGQDEDGLEIVSCAIRPSLNAPQAKAKPIRGKHQLAAMATLNGAFHGTAGGVTYEDAIQQVAAVLGCPKGRAQSVAKSTIAGLLRDGHLFLDNGYVKSLDGNHRNPFDTEPP